MEPSEELAVLTAKMFEDMLRTITAPPRAHVHVVAPGVYGWTSCANCGAGIFVRHVLA
jgi:hypothetical protein